METDDADIARIMQRTKEREAFIEKENALLDQRTGLSSAQGDNATATASHPLSSRNEEQTHSGQSIYPTDELETMKRISMDDPYNMSYDSPSAAGADSNTRAAKRRARFAALAADVENFEYDVKPSRPKELFVKGPSPRLSSGDTSPAALFTPTASYYPPASAGKLSSSSLPRIEEGKPVCAPSDDTIAYVDDSFEAIIDEKETTTVVTSIGKSLESTKPSRLDRITSEKRLRFATPEYKMVGTDSSPERCTSSQDKSPGNCTAQKQSADGDMTSDKKTTESDANNRSDSEYGIHKFFKRKSPEKLSNFQKNDGNEQNAKEHKEYKGTPLIYRRGDIVDEIAEAANRATGNDTCRESHAKLMAKQLDEKIREERPKSKITPKISATLSKLESQHTQTKKQTQNAEIDTRSADVKNLRNRWEVSSATGTPLHPDQEEDELLQAAIRMAKSVEQAKKMRPQSYCETRSPNESPDFRPISAATSLSCIRSMGNSREQSFKAAGEQYAEVQGKAIKANTSGKSNTEPNQLIDDAFQFINQTPDKNSSLMSAILSTPEIQTTISPRFMPAETNENVDATAPLAHSVSFYRRKEKENRSASETVILGQFTTSPFDNSSSNLNRTASKSSMNEKAKFEVERARLEKAISVQQEQIVQASRALSFCHSTHEFRGSREEVDAQRALLIATERRRALIFVLDRLIQKHATGGIQHPIPEGPRGNLTFSDISVKLMRDFVNGHINYHDGSFSDHLLFYFIVLIRHEETVHHTTLTTSDEGICSGRLEFPHYIQFRSLPHDFVCTLEIFALRTRRELLRHEAKYHIKGTSSLRKSHKSMFAPGAVSLGGPSAVIDPSFQRVGHLSLNISSVNKTKFQLTDTLYPLDGFVEMKVRCYAEDCGTIGYKGFLSLYQPVENIASWTRFWCVLWDGQLRFWRYPEDESTKIPVVSIDLRTCACNEIKPIPVERCPYPNSMQIDVWLPGRNPQKPDRIRILMAADRKDEMHSWLNAMNISLRNLTLWSSRP